MVLLRRSWPFLRWVVAAGALFLIYEELAGRRGEFSGFSTVVGHLHWWWLPAAVAFEAASVVAFAGVQARLLGAAGVATPTRPLVGITLAANAIANSLPGGPALGAIYSFRWYRRLGADDPVAVWALVGTAVTAFLSLALVASAGLVLAFGQGVSLDLIPVVIGLLLLTVAAGFLFVYERPLALAVEWGLRACRRLTGRPRGDLQSHIVSVVERVTVVRLDWGKALALLGWGLSNWLCDCACFALCFWVLGVGVPWRALLLAYGAGQLAANLPVTPGGLGAVTGSITLALAYFGGAHPTTIYVVLMYRLISFWGVVTVGWGAWGWGALAVRRGRWPRHVMRGEAVLGDGEGEVGSRAGLAAPATGAGT